jgi:hypothetical protein
MAAEEVGEGEPMPRTQEKIEDYNVDIAVRVEVVDDDAPDRLLEALEAVDVQAVVVHTGPDTIGAQFFVDAGFTPEDAITHATGTFLLALEKAQITGEFASLQIVSGEVFERELAQEPETYAGVTEVAKLLGVSRQRVSELRGSSLLPAPVAELAAGPVWSVSTLTRFIDTWERKPGRPRKVRTVG